ncbi:MAG: isochorismatase family protein [Marinobacter sp.]|uniref:isochorismatase family protein n=1 Tax=Marinobacter sp. TaxID=50741 RepID=UPI0032985DB9
MAEHHDFENHCWQDLYPQEIYDLYAPYRRQTGIKGRCGLLLVDLYNLCYEGGERPVSELYRDYPSSCGEFAWRALGPTRQILHEMRLQGLPVLFSTKDLRNADHQRKASATFRRSGQASENAYDIHPELTPENGELVIAKERASCFYGTPLATYLQRLRIETLIMVGESTSGCVRATATDSFSYGFHTVLVEEAVFDRNPISHQASLFDLHHKYADVMALDDVLNQLRDKTR